LAAWTGFSETGFAIPGQEKMIEAITFGERLSKAVTGKGIMDGLLD
jgi:hypothetical protein